MSELEQKPFSIECKRPEFKIDLLDFEKWLKDNFENFSGLASVGLFLIANFSSPVSEQGQADISNHLLGLTENGETVKLEKASRKKGPELTAFLQSKKSAVAAKDWAEMSVAERKLAMNAQLTPDEIDSL